MRSVYFGWRMAQSRASSFMPTGTPSQRPSRGPTPGRSVSRGARRRAWRKIRWRWGLLLVAFVLGYAGFSMGVGVSSRSHVADAGFLPRAYYTIGLFVLGGLDLGVPTGGPLAGRVMLWISYFLAPAITASAVVEGVLRAIGPRNWALRTMRGHIVIGGCGKLTMQYLRRLRERYPHKPVVIIDARHDGPHIEEAQEVYGATIVIGDIASKAQLRSLRLEHAERALLLTGDDFANLDAAATILGHAPHLTERIVAHVADLHFMRVLEKTQLSHQVTVFNTHEIAAAHLVNTRLLQHFHKTEPLDTVVIAGFGRFGQTVLDRLQTHAAGKFDRVVLIDIDCQRRTLLFEEQVGFSDGYTVECADGDLRDPDLWRRLDADCALRDGEPAFVIGSGDTGINIHTALWLQNKYPEAYVVARSFRRSRFAEEISKEGGFEVFSVAELVVQSIPDDWLN
jgi:Trk K+ transport system NAD-binding subunit